AGHCVIYFRKDHPTVPAIFNHCFIDLNIIILESCFITRQPFLSYRQHFCIAEDGDPLVTVLNEMGYRVVSAFIIIGNYFMSIDLIYYPVKENEGHPLFVELPEIAEIICFCRNRNNKAIYRSRSEIL